MAFVSGINKAVTWVSQSGLGTTTLAVTLNVTEHSWSEMIDKVDVTHSGSGGVQALLMSILRGDGNVKAFTDDAISDGISAIGIFAGHPGILRFMHFSTGIVISVPSSIIKVNYKTVIAGASSYDFDVSLNSIAGTYYRHLA